MDNFASNHANRSGFSNAISNGWLVLARMLRTNIPVAGPRLKPSMAWPEALVTF